MSNVSQDMEPVPPPPTSAQPSRARVDRRRWIRLGCGGVLIVLLGAIAWNWRDLSVRASNTWVVLAQAAYWGGLDTPERLLNLLAQQRDTMAIASYAVGSDGTVVSGSQLLHNADQPMPLASTMKIVVLAGYARQVSIGELNPEERIELGAWDRFYLPGTDGGAHEAALGELGFQLDEQGFAVNPAETVRLDQLVNAMIRWSDNAATDYLLDRLGSDVLQATITEGKLQQHTPIRSLVGTFLTWQNHEQPRITTDQIEALVALSPEAYAVEVDRMARLYDDPVWRAAELAWRAGGVPIARVYPQVLAADRLIPMGTAREYAQTMGGVLTNTFMTPQISQIMRQYLTWPMEIEGNNQQFETFGAKGGSLPGVLTDAMFLVPRAGSRAGERRVVVVFMRDLPFMAYLRLNQTFAQQQFAIRLATDPAFEQRVRDQLTQQ